MGSLTLEHSPALLIEILKRQARIERELSDLTHRVAVLEGPDSDFTLSAEERAALNPPRRL